MRASGQVVAVTMCGLCFALLGIADLSFSSGIAETLVSGATPLIMGAWLIGAAAASGVRRSKGRVLYRGVGSRTLLLRPTGTVTVDTGMYLPLVYLHRIVVSYPDGTSVGLPGASVSSFRRSSAKAERRRATLQRWLDDAGDGGQET